MYVMQVVPEKHINILLALATAATYSEVIQAIQFLCRPI